MYYVQPITTPGEKPKGDRLFAYRLSPKGIYYSLTFTMDRTAMDRTQLAFIADVLGIVTGIMTILGVGGILSWGLFRRHGSPLSDRLLEILAYSVKTFIFLVLTFLLFQLFWLFTSIASSIFGDGTYRSLQEAVAITSVPYALGALVSGLLFLPSWIVLCVCVYTWSFSPLIRLGEIIRHRGLTRNEDKENQPN